MYTALFSLPQIHAEVMGIYLVWSWIFNRITWKQTELDNNSVCIKRTCVFDLNSYKIASLINILDPCRLTKSFSLKITGIPQMYKLKVSEMRKTVNKMKSRLYHKEVLKFFYIWWWRGWQSHVMQCFKIICKLRVIKITTHNFVLFTNEGFFYSVLFFFLLSIEAKTKPILY